MARRSRKPRGYRDVDGILLLDKPLGLSSNKALQAARNLFKANKAGHTGSLDPLATGLLPVCFGEATKFSSFLLDSSKSYRAQCQLGQTSSTGDGEGELSEQREVRITHEQLQRVLTDFTGTIAQVPPMHSAVKHDGQRLYALARQGVEVERASREIQIYRLDLLAFADDRLELDIHCSKGTYIRTLVEDIGEALGCGAYLAGLERTGVEPFWTERRYSLDELRAIDADAERSLDDCLLPMETALAEFPAVELDTNLTFYLKQGQPVQVPRAPINGYVRLIDEDQGFIGVGHILSDGRVAPKRMLRE